MKSIFKATAMLSGSSILSILLSLVSAKVMALYLQPAGYGYYGLLQSFVGLVVLLAGMGMATGLVRLGASAIARDEQAAFANLQSGAWLLFLVLSCLTLSIMWTFRQAVSQWSLGTAERGNTIMLMTLAVLLTVAANIHVGILNAYHRVAALAKYGVANTIGGAAASITAVLIWGIHGVVPAVIVSALVSLLLSRYFLRCEIIHSIARPAFKGMLKSALSLVRFGGPFTASQMVGTGVQLALPMVVLHLLGTESVGYYKAAVGISVGYLGFLITAMGQDYYPRLAAVSDKPDTLVKLINEQHRLVMILAVPIILGTLSLVPFLVPLVYSLRFGPTIEILEWQMIGDLFKFSSWTMSFAILARCGSSVYFLTELVGGGVHMAGTWLFVRWLGIPGLGIAFLVTYILYYGVVWAVLRREIPFLWTSHNKRLMLAGVAAALTVRVLPSTHLASLRMPIGLILAIAAGVASLRALWKEYVASKDFQPVDQMRTRPDSETAATQV